MIEKILNSDMLFLPGVGSYDTAINFLKKKNLVDVINEATIIKKKNFRYLLGYAGNVFI